MHLHYPASRYVTNVNALQVSFRERATNYRALLREMTCKYQDMIDSYLLTKYMTHSHLFPQKSPIISGSFAERDLQCIHICDTT